MMDDLELLGEMLKDTALAPTKTDPYGKKSSSWKNLTTIRIPTIL